MCWNLSQEKNSTKIKEKDFVALVVETNMVKCLDAQADIGKS